jgi:quercetin dioxygenase-like cupin family protein
MRFTQYRLFSNFLSPPRGNRHSRELLREGVSFQVDLGYGRPAERLALVATITVGADPAGCACLIKSRGYDLGQRVPSVFGHLSRSLGKRMGTAYLRPRYRLMVVAAAIVSAAAGFRGMTLIAPLQAQTLPEPTQRVEVLSQPLPDIPGREVRMLALDLMPGHASPPHRHPGHDVFGYVLEGTYEWKIDDQPMKTFKRGEAFYEPPGALHSISRNPSATERTKLLVFMVAQESLPGTVAESDRK